MRSQHNSRCGYRKLLLVIPLLLLFSSCYTIRVETKAQAGAAPSHKNVNFYLWGLLQNPKQITTPDCDALNVNGMATVTVKRNLGDALISVVTLGIWSPAQVEWECGKPYQKIGTINGGR